MAMLQQIKKFYKNFPRRFFTSYSWVIDDWKDFRESLHQYISSTRCSTSIYNFAYTPEAVTIDRVAFDLDTEDSYSQMRKLSKYLEQKNIKHTVFCSGKNFHVYAKVIAKKYKNKKGVVGNIQTEIQEKLKITNDPTLIGSLTHNLSIPFTFNFRRRKFVRPLSHNEIEKSWEEILKLCDKQGGKIETIGEEGIDGDGYDTEYKPKKNILADVEDFDFGDAEINLLPAKAKILLKNSDLRHKDRLYVISCMAEAGFTRKMIYSALKKYLSPKRFFGCVQERQIEGILRIKHRW